MVNLESLYNDCRSYIGMRTAGMTSNESLMLYAFAEQYATEGKVQPEVVEAVEKIIAKYQEIQIQI